MSSLALRPRVTTTMGLLLVAAFIAVGAVGLERYLRNFWLYRGFPPPSDPAFVQVKGTRKTLLVTSAALGGRRQQVVVYLPPGYAAHPRRRYPVYYLLHGFPGRPQAFLDTVRAGVVEDTLVAKHLVRAAILVMPYGSTGTFTDEEWANGAAPHSGWETFVARDLVHYVDRHFRTIAARAGRVIAGLSEGGYGAINIAIHHPHEFQVVESWSGYEIADNVPAVFHRDRRLLQLNTPLLTLPRVASTLRREHVYFWLYSGSRDDMRFQNGAFSRELTRLGLAHRYFLVRGGHNWALWRGNASLALRVASHHLAVTPAPGGGRSA